MIKILSVKATRNFDNPEPTPGLHWVEFVFQNEHGVHTIELNGACALPEEPALNSDLAWLLWDYGLLCQQDTRTARQRVRVAQEQIATDRKNYLLARAYLEKLA